MSPSKPLKRCLNIFFHIAISVPVIGICKLESDSRYKKTWNVSSDANMPPVSAFYHIRVLDRSYRETSSIIPLPSTNVLDKFSNFIFS